MSSEDVHAATREVTRLNEERTYGFARLYHFVRLMHGEQMVLAYRHGRLLTEPRDLRAQVPA